MDSDSNTAFYIILVIGIIAIIYLFWRKNLESTNGVKHFGPCVDGIKASISNNDLASDLEKTYSFTSGEIKNLLQNLQSTNDQTMTQNSRDLVLQMVSSKASYLNDIFNKINETLQTYDPSQMSDSQKERMINAIKTVNQDIMNINRVLAQHGINRINFVRLPIMTSAGPMMLSPGAANILTPIAPSIVAPAPSSGDYYNPDASYAPEMDGDGSVMLTEGPVAPADDYYVSDAQQ